MKPITKRLRKAAANIDKIIMREVLYWKIGRIEAECNVCLRENGEEFEEKQRHKVDTPYTKCRIVETATPPKTHFLKDSHVNTAFLRNLLFNGSDYIHRFAESLQFSMSELRRKMGTY